MKEEEESHSTSFHGRRGQTWPCGQSPNADVETNREQGGQSQAGVERKGALR